MARLPSLADWVREEEEILDATWEHVCSSEDPVDFFHELELTIKANLSTVSRIRITRAMVAYRDGARGNLDPNALDEALRLVKRIRRDIRDLQKLLDQYKKQVAGIDATSGEKVLAEGARECVPIYQDALDCVERLRSLAGYSGPVVSDQLWEVLGVVSEAMAKVEAPLLMVADCAKALGVLDGSIARWASLTKARMRQRSQSRRLSGFIERLDAVFRDATDRSPKGKSGFRSFVKRILSALTLPKGAYHGVATDAALPARIRRLLAD